MGRPRLPLGQRRPRRRRRQPQRPLVLRRAGGAQRHLAALRRPRRRRAPPEPRQDEDGFGEVRPAGPLRVGRPPRGGDPVLVQDALRAGRRGGLGPEHHGGVRNNSPRVSGGSSSPALTRPCIARSRPAQPRRACSTLPCLTRPCPVGPFRTTPKPTCFHRAGPDRTNAGLCRTAPRLPILLHHVSPRPA